MSDKIAGIPLEDLKDIEYVLSGKKGACIRRIMHGFLKSCALTKEPSYL